MGDRVLFVDLENVQTLDVAKVPADARVMVFYGVTQKNLPEALVVQAQPLGSRLQWIKCAGQGKNALDFHIAFYVGRELSERPRAQCVVLSKDTGFDPLVRHLHGLGHEVRRLSTLKDALASPEAPGTNGAKDPYARVVELLGKEKHRPLKRSGLAGKLKSYLPSIADEERATLLERLFAEGKVSEQGGTLVYGL